MAVVKTEIVYLEPLAKKWRKITDINPKTGKFRIAMPREFTNFFSDRDVVGDTLNEVESAFRTAVYEWSKAREKERKIILYRFCITSLGDPDEDGRSKVLRNDFYTSFEQFPASCLGFEFEIGREVTLGKEVRYFKIREADDEFDSRMGMDEPQAETESLNGNRIKVVTWSQEREDFFTAINVGLNAMIKKVMDFDEAIKNESDLDKVLKLGGAALLRLSPAKEKP